MPFLKNSGLVKAYSTIATLQNYDFNLSANSTYRLSVQAVYTDATPAAVVVPSASITFATCTFTHTAHGFVTGLDVQFTTDDTLPSGISALTDYFVIVVDANHFKVASSLANAVAGTAITLTNAGTGNQTATPQALSYALNLLASNDGVSFIQLLNADTTPKSVTITAAGTSVWDLGAPGYKILRLAAVPTTGAVNLTYTYNSINLF